MRRATVVTAAISLVLLLFQATFPTRSAAQSGCVAGVPPIAENSETVSWAQGEVVEVYYSSNLLPDQKNILDGAFGVWSHVAGSNVRFVISLDDRWAADPPTGAVGLTRGNLPPDQPGRTALRPGSDGLQRAVMVINDSIIDINGFRSALGHEIGHTFGLADCEGCGNKTTIMGWNVSRGELPDYPTACDRAAAHNAGNYGPDQGPTYGGGGGQDRGCNWRTVKICEITREADSSPPDLSNPCSSWHYEQRLECAKGIIPPDWANQPGSTGMCGYADWYGPNFKTSCNANCSVACVEKQLCGDNIYCNPGPCWKCPTSGNESYEEELPLGSTCADMGWFGATENAACDMQCGQACSKKQWCGDGLCQPYPNYCWKCGSSTAAQPPSGTTTMTFLEVIPVKLTLSAQTAYPSSALGVQYAFGPRTKTDWLGVFRVTDPDTWPQSWVYLNGTNSPVAAPLASGTVQVTLPSSLGSYDIRFFRNGTYDRMAHSVPVQVIARPGVPVISSITGNGGSCHPNCSVTFTANASDPDGDALTYSWSGCATGTSKTASCSVPTVGPRTATVTVSDGYGHFTSGTATATGINSAPTVLCPGNYTVKYNTVVTSSLYGSDPDGDAVTCSATVRAGSSDNQAVIYDADCGAVTVQACSYNSGTAQCYNVIAVTVRDSFGATGSCQFRVTGKY
jgi:hypothetical protein